MQLMHHDEKMGNEASNWKIRTKSLGTIVYVTEDEEVSK